MSSLRIDVVLARAALLAFAPFGCTSSPQPPLAAAPIAGDVRDHENAEEGAHDAHHELHPPPVTTHVSVTLDGRAVDVDLAALPHDSPSVPLASVWRAAFPDVDPAPLHFDLTGSDDFHPASRPACSRPLTGTEVGAARLDLASHNVTYDPPVQLPGCYRVKAVVRIDGAHGSAR